MRTSDITPKLSVFARLPTKLGPQWPGERSGQGLSSVSAVVDRSEAISRPLLQELRGYLDYSGANVKVHGNFEGALWALGSGPKTIPESEVRASISTFRPPWSG